MAVCSIVIRAYNEEDHIGRLLEGIQKQTIQDVEIILVDSGSTDQTRAIAEKYSAKIVQIRPQDFSFGRSLNQGIQASTTDKIAIASAHVYPVYPDWLEKLIAPLSNVDYALVYGKQRGGEQSHFSEKQIFRSWYGEQSLIPQDHPFCNNANAAIRKDFWKLHPYNESLPGLEDLEWAKWAMEQNYKIVYSAEAEIIHIHEEDWGGIQKRYLREGMAFKQIYPHESFNLIDLIHLFSKNSIADIKEAIESSQFRKELANILKFRWRQFYGTFLGYWQSGPLTWQLKQSFYYPKNGGVQPDNQSTSRPVQPIDYGN